MQLQRLPIPSRALAVALATLGYQVTPKAYHHERTGALTLQWFCDSDVLGAQKLLDSLSAPQPLSVLQPEHPLLLCLYYQEALEALQTWLRTAGRPVALRAGKHSRFLRLLPHGCAHQREDLSALLPLPPEAAAIAQPHHAAAAVVCGFVPHPQLDLTTTVPRFQFSLESFTFPGLTLAAVQRITAPPTADVPDPTGLAAYPPGEHPACYALQCAANTTAFLHAEALVLKNPVHMMRGDGTRSALMSESLISARDSRYRDRLRRHLAGLT